MLEKVGFCFGLFICVCFIALTAGVIIGGIALAIYAIKMIKEELLESD